MPTTGLFRIVFLSAADSFLSLRIESVMMQVLLESGSYICCAHVHDCRTDTPIADMSTGLSHSFLNASCRSVSCSPLGSTCKVFQGHVRTPPRVHVAGLDQLVGSSSSWAAFNISKVPFSDLAVAEFVCGTWRALP